MISESVRPTKVLLKTVALRRVEVRIVLPLMIETLTKLLLIVEDVTFESKDVEFSILALIWTPPNAVALRNVLFETNVPTKVTLMRMEPEIVLFSTRLLVMVLLVILTVNALTVLRSDSLILD